MKLVAVTACATGIAHTYMAAEQLKKPRRPSVSQIKVETQGAMGVENELSASDIKQAQVAIFAADIEIEGSERFDGVKQVRVPVPGTIDVKVAEAVADEIVDKHGHGLRISCHSDSDVIVSPRRRMRRLSQGLP